MAIVQALPVLAVTAEVTKLAAIYRKELRIPAKAESDATHLAFAVVYEMDYLATWNCAHIANGDMLKALRKVNEHLDLFQPIIVTPESLVPP